MRYQLLWKMAKQVSTKTQIAKLVEMMEKDESLAKNILSKEAAKKRWAEIANVLNNYGPPFKTGEKWARVWIDMKSKLKKKLSENRAELRATGGGPNLMHSLSPVESAVEKLLCMNQTVNPPGREFGTELNRQGTSMNNSLSALDNSLNSANVSSENIIMSFEEAEMEFSEASASSSSKAAKKTRSRPSKPNDLLEERMSILQEQTKHQKDFYQEMLRKMDKITDIFKEMQSQQNQFFKEFIDCFKESVMH